MQPLEFSTPESSGYLLKGPEHLNLFYNSPNMLYNEKCRAQPNCRVSCTNASLLCCFFFRLRRVWPSSIWLSEETPDWSSSRCRGVGCWTSHTFKNCIQRLWACWRVLSRRMCDLLWSESSTTAFSVCGKLWPTEHCKKQAFEPRSAHIEHLCAHAPSTNHNCNCYPTHVREEHQKHHCMLCRWFSDVDTGLHTACEVVECLPFVSSPACKISAAARDLSNGL